MFGDRAGHFVYLSHSILSSFLLSHLPNFYSLFRDLTATPTFCIRSKLQSFPYYRGIYGKGTNLVKQSSPPTMVGTIY